MLLPVLALWMLAAGADSADQPITVVAHPWAPFISPMGEPFRARSAEDDPPARWFQQADGDGDGMLSSAEMQADAERFFAVLDVDRSGELGPEEIVRYEWEIAPEIQVNSRWKSPRGQAAADRERRGARRSDDNSGYRIGGLQGAARYTLLNIPQPVASADTDFNRSITLDEFRRAANYRFRLLDRERQGRLTLPELHALLPPPRKAGRRSRPPKDAPDTRIGNRLPSGD